MTNQSLQAQPEIEAEPLLDQTEAEEEEEEGYGDRIYPEAPQDLGFQPMSMASETGQEDEDESAWLAELQRRPWHLRPGMLWLTPFLFAIGLVITAISSPIEQLNIQIVCKDFYLSQQHVPQDFMEHAGLVLQDDRCKTPDVLGVAALVQSRIHAVRGTFSKDHRLDVESEGDTSNVLTYPHNPFGYRLLYVDSILLGLTAGSSLIQPAITAYVGGYMVKQTGDLTSVIRISLAGFAILLLYLIAMPESLRKHANPQIPERDDNKDTRHVKKLSFLTSIWNAVKRGFLAILEPLLFFAPGSIPVSHKAPSKYTLALIVIATHLVKLGLFGVYALFIPLTNLVFKWTSYEDGFFFSYVGVCSFGAYLGVFPLLQFLYKRFIIRTSKPKAHGYTQVEQLENELETFNLEERQPAPAVVEESSDTDTISTLKMDASFFLGGTILFGISFIIVPLFMSIPIIFIGKLSGYYHARF
ncbi:hypothetical protein BGX34_009341 [Mortierella sp. NVP85]|nr:hypothetical protein BGX34_009341 [Mortierella sp. NVP85]